MATVKRNGREPPPEWRERILALRPLTYETLGDPEMVRWLNSPGVDLSRGPESGVERG
jgi:hypothetical protein